MTPEAHLRKAARIRRTMDRTPDQLYEIVIEGAMLAGNHHLNAMLHRLGIRAEADDIIHTDYLYVSEHRRLAILAGELLELLERIEELRAPFVRGSAPGGVEAAQSARRLLDRLAAAYEAVPMIDLPMRDYRPAKAAAP